MFPPFLAFAWTLWRRHYLGLLLALVYLTVASILSAILPAGFAPAAVPSVFAPLVLPVVGVYVYLLPLFVYGVDGTDVLARDSCFPAGMFTLPVRTAALAGWPMAYGAAAVALLWLVTAWFIMRPWLTVLGGSVPLWWPAMLAVVFLVWVQALLWTPFALPGLRVALVIILVPGMIVLINMSVAFGASEGFLVGLFSLLALAGSAVAYAGVRRARYGDVPNWEALFEPWRRLGRRLPRRRQPFASAARAQTWFEWRRSGSSLPLMTGVLLPFGLLFLALPKNEEISMAQVLLSALFLPLFLAGFGGTTVSGKNPWVKDYYGVALSTATLPLSTAAMVGAKLKAAAVSTLAAWLILAVEVFLAVLLSDRLDEVAGWWQQAVHEYHPVKVVAGMLASAVLLVVWTWKRMVDSLFLGLTGRKWVIQGTIFVSMTGFCLLCGLAGWIYRHPETHETFRSALPWLLGLWLLCKLLASAWALRRGLRQGLLAPRLVKSWLLAWLLLAAALIGVLAWVVPPNLVPTYQISFAVVLVLPMTHLAATPLALAWSRHR
jgi:hypothetical protein